MKKPEITEDRAGQIVKELKKYREQIKVLKKKGWGDTEAVMTLEEDIRLAKRELRSIILGF